MHTKEVRPAMSFEETTSFVNSFVSKNGGSTPYMWRALPKIIYKKWFDAHQTIRDRLGGDTVDLNIELPDAIAPLPQEKCQEFYDKFNGIHADLMRSSSLSPADLALPTKPHGTHNVIRVSRQIVQGSRAVASSLTKEKLKEIEVLLSQLGEAWANNNVRGAKYIVTISVSPRAFLLIGHYGPDKDSCFRQGSSRELDKWCLMQSKDTFVLTIAGENDDKINNVARWYGVVRSDGVRFYNLYLREHMTAANAMEAARVAVNAAFDLPLSTPMLDEPDQWQSTEVYINPEFGRKFMPARLPAFPHSDCRFTSQHIKSFVCDHTDRPYRGTTDGYVVVDDKICHVDCKKTAFQLYNNEYTFEEHNIVEIIDANGNPLLVHRRQMDDVAKQFAIAACLECGQLHVVADDGLCYNCAQLRDTCEVCGSNSICDDVDDVTICRSCRGLTVA